MPKLTSARNPPTQRPAVQSVVNNKPAVRCRNQVVGRTVGRGRVNVPPGVVRRDEETGSVAAGGPPTGKASPENKAGGGGGTGGGHGAGGGGGEVAGVGPNTQTVRRRG